MTAVLNNPVERGRFLKFMVVGAIGALIDFGVANVLTSLLHMDLVPAGTISLACAIVSNFIWNRYWTYPESRSRALAHQLGMFTAVNVAGVAIRVPILHYVEPVLLRSLESQVGNGPLSAEFLARNITLAIAVAIVMLWNFFVNRHWTYNDVDLGRETR
ncbi:MAG TPA: GtrA family protein [Anaerolineales bacterium]|nr:GtrA family protein [Anaerolineales bacterium]